MSTQNLCVFTVPELTFSAELLTEFTQPPCAITWISMGAHKIPSTGNYTIVCRHAVEHTLGQPMKTEVGCPSGREFQNCHMQNSSPKKYIKEGMLEKKSAWLTLTDWMWQEKKAESTKSCPVMKMSSQRWLADTSHRPSCTTAVPDGRGSSARRWAHSPPT